MKEACRFIFIYIYTLQALQYGVINRYGLTFLKAIAIPLLKFI